MTFEVDFTNPRDGWRGRKVGKVSFVPERIDNSVRRKETSYGVREYFLVWVADSDHVMSFPKKYWPPDFNIGDKVTVEVETEKYQAGNSFVNVCNFKDAMAPEIERTSSAGMSGGEQTGVRISTQYVTKRKEDASPTGGIFGYYNAPFASIDGETGVSRIRFDQASTVLMPGSFDWLEMNKTPEENLVLTNEDLQFAEMLVDGDKTGSLFTVKSIETFTKIKNKKEIKIPVNNLVFIGGIDNDLSQVFIEPGATFTYEEENAKGGKDIYSGFIPESDFPFECSPIVNRIKELYPEEFAHSVTISGLYNRHDRIKKIDNNWVTTSYFSAATPLKALGLDVPTIADNLVRVTDSFYKNEKYKKAALALKQMKGAVTYSKAAKTFSDLGLTFTEDEYYREIESRLVAEHKDYDREFFDILKERVDEANGAEWGGNPETGEFVAIFPEEKLIVIEMPVPNKATYFYRIHDGMDSEESLARINLASPSNGVRRSALLSGNTFRQEIYDRWSSSRDTAWLSARMTYLNNLVSEGIIGDMNDNLKAWTGFIGRAMHRSYENYTLKLDEALGSAAKMTLTSTGYQETKTNPFDFFSPMISGTIAALTGFIVGDYVERGRMSNQLDESLKNLDVSTTMNLNDMMKSGYSLIGAGHVDELDQEVMSATKSGYSNLQTIQDGQTVFVLGMKSIRNNPASPAAVKAYDTFHDQPHKNLVKARPHMKTKDMEILGPMKHVVYFCSKWSEDESGNVIDDNNVDIHYIHEWNEEGSGNDCGPNCMYVAASKDRKNIVLLGDCEVLDVGITDATKANKRPEVLLKNYSIPSDMSWLGECIEIAYIDENDDKKVIKLKNTELATDGGMKKLYLVETK